MANPPRAATLYTTSLTSWHDSIDSAVILDDSGSEVGTFPMQFLRDGGPGTLTARYLLHVCRLILEIPLDFDLIIRDGAGAINPADIITPTHYSINGTFALRHGPAGKTRSKPFRETDSNGTYSQSSRSSATQSKFKMELVQRDSACLVSDNFALEELVGCHIVPFSLGQEKLREICQPETVQVSSIENGLLLASSLHKSFDQYVWGIYPFEGSLYVHMFGASHHEWHGKRLHFRSRPWARPPKAKLLEWHYAQCLMARIRGFSVHPLIQRPSTRDTVSRSHILSTAHS